MKVFTKDEYDNLIYGLVAYPSNLQVTGNKINKSIATVQYNNLINTLTEFGVKIQFLNLNNSPSQVFTKDIGFVIEDIMFVSNMTEPIRQTEIDKLVDFALSKNIKIHYMKSKVEGGDILVHRDKVFIGQSSRTGIEAVEEIKAVLEGYKMNYEMIKVNFDISKVHLDCVVNILDSSTCILSDYVYNPEVITGHFSKIIRASKIDTDALGPNIINLGNNIILCCNENLTNILLSHSYNAVFIKFSEIVKAKGGLGCCILELLRGNN